MLTAKAWAMRTTPLVLAITIVGACTVSSDNGSDLSSPIDRLTAGKMAGPPIKCLPSFVARDQLVLSSTTIAYRAGSSLVYVNHLAEGCPPLESHLTLVTHSLTGELCRGDIVTLVEPPSNMPVGSCSLGDFIPYTAASK